MQQTLKCEIINFRSIFLKNRVPRRNQIEKNRRGCTVKRRSNIFQFVNESRKQSQEEVDDDRWFVVAILLFSLNEKQKKQRG